MKDDVKITDSRVIVDFHGRKKNGLEVPPLKIPRTFCGVNDVLVPYFEGPERLRVNTVFCRKMKNGIRTCHSEEDEAQWLFPHICPTTALRVAKKVLGEQYYCHYLRLRKLSKIGMYREKGL